VNQEANIVVKDRDFAQALRDHIRHGVVDAVQVHPEAFRNTPWHKRAWYGAAFLLYRAMLRVITMGKYT
jgi:cardiolipin synthase